MSPDAARIPLAAEAYAAHADALADAFFDRVAARTDRHGS